MRLKISLNGIGVIEKNINFDGTFKSVCTIEVSTFQGCQKVPLYGLQAVVCGGYDAILQTEV